MPAESALPSVAGTEVAESVSRFRLSLVREAVPELQPPQSCMRPDTVAPLLHRLVADADRELVGVLYLDTRMRLSGYTICYVGTINRAACEPRGIFVPALLAHATSVLVFHNHPSGDTTPSQQDIAFSEKLVASGDILGISVVDHIILGEPPNFVSLKDRGVIS